MSDKMTLLTSGVAPACEEEAGAGSGSDRKRGSGRVVSAVLEAVDAASYPS